jgi:hypothetical protein
MDNLEGEKVVVFKKLKGLRASKDKSQKLNRKQNYWLKSRIIDKVRKIRCQCCGYKVNGDINEVFQRVFHLPVIIAKSR